MGMPLKNYYDVGKSDRDAGRTGVSRGMEGRGVECATRDRLSRDVSRRFTRRSNFRARAGGSGRGMVSLLRRDGGVGISSFGRWHRNFKSKLARVASSLS